MEQRSDTPLVGKEAVRYAGYSPAVGRYLRFELPVGLRAPRDGQQDDNAEKQHAKWQQELYCNRLSTWQEE